MTKHPQKGPRKNSRHLGFFGIEGQNQPNSHFQGGLTKSKMVENLLFSFSLSNIVKQEKVLLLTHCKKCDF